MTPPEPPVPALPPVFPPPPPPLPPPVPVPPLLLPPEGEAEPEPEFGPDSDSEDPHAESVVTHTMHDTRPAKEPRKLTETEPTRLARRGRGACFCSAPPTSC